MSASEQRHWLSLGRFEQFLDFIAQRPNCRVTLDDGNASDYEVALPALLDRHLKAEFFLTTGNLDHPGYLARQQVRALADAGMTIGSHGHSHRSFRRSRAEQLRQELIQSRSLLEDMVEKPITALALPFGDYDRRVLKGVRDAGYERVLTTDRGPAHEHAWLQSRTTVYDSDDPGTFEEVLLREATGVRAGVRKVKSLLKRWR